MLDSLPYRNDAAQVFRRQARYLPPAQARAGRLALVMSEKRDVSSQDILTNAAFRNAMVVHAASGGSTDLILHMPAIAHAAGRARISLEDRNRVNKETPRIVDILLNSQTLDGDLDWPGASGLTSAVCFPAGNLAQKAPPS